MADDDTQGFTPWTPQGAARLLAAADELVVAIREHAEAVTRATGHTHFGAVVAAHGALLPVLLRYADAQFDYTGNGFPFGVLGDLAEDDADDSEETSDVDADVPPTVGLTVLRRQDYEVTDEVAVLAAGRAAYLRVWPDDDEDDAARDVTHLGRALYQVAHAYGWDGMDGVDGLTPTGGVVVVLRPEEPLTGRPDGWPDDPFDVDGERLFEQTDVHGGR